METDTVKRIAGIARIELTEEETKRFKEEIDAIIGHVDLLNDVPENGSFCFDPVGVFDALREDVPVVSDVIGEMMGAMSMYDGLVRGPKIV